MDSPRPDQPPWAESVAALRILLAVVWLVVPAVATWDALMYSVAFFGESVDRQDILKAARYLGIGAAVAFGVPPAGLFLATWADNRPAIRRWKVGCALGTLVGALLFAGCVSFLRDTRDPAPRHSPTGTYCAEYSGPPNTCPGG
ncbi:MULTISPECIES: hypothetical protein [Pseudofrankia]|uniref:hypothetical protein n=1 Tax=Pseudofrankia TaxID=2994363 RepID=UPI000234DA9C|nr:MULTISPECIES: hypothetical protein [Pseudofrankia]OHV33822.1 hypothetical protein BCD49_25145 [Pseudofrankia sp. EUN1h]